MHLNRIFFIFIFCGLTAAWAYKIPKPKLEILPQGFRISIPDEPGISEVLFSIEINKMCPGYIYHASQANNNFWTMNEQKLTLQENDNIMIFIIVQVKEDIFKIYEYIKMGKNGAYTNVEGDSDTNNISNEIAKGECFGTASSDTATGITDNKLEKTEQTFCTISQTIMRNVRTVCKGELIFEETFNENTKLNLSRWSYDIRIRLNGLRDSEEFVVFDNNESNHYIKDGVLFIVPTINTKNIRHGSIDLGTRCTAQENPARDCNSVSNGHIKVLPPVYSTQIHTRNFFSFKYGRVEIRAKLPKGDWILPYIMLQPSAMYIDSEKATQIRIAFSRGNDHLLTVENDDIGGSRLYGGINFMATDYRRSIMTNVKSEEHFGNAFHIYSLTWTETSITVAVDGQTYGYIRENLDKFREECFLILGVSAGGHKEFADNLKPAIKPWLNTSPRAALDFWRNRTRWINTWNGSGGLQIDYVKVFAL